MSDKQEVISDEVNSKGRRDFLVKAGRFAAVTPVAVTVLLSTSMEADAHRFHKSGGGPKPGGKGKGKKKGWKKNKWWKK